LRDCSIPHLRELEEEAIYVIRAVWAQFEKPALLFSGRKDSIDSGKAVEETGVNASRNVLQTVTLLDAIEEFSFDAALF